MIKKKRHSTAEVAAKLAQADALAAEGQSQRHIARSLDVSVMTLHRWRKILAPLREGANSSRGPSFNGHSKSDDDLSELKVENLRLRRLVTDLLLEKVKLEETLQGPKR